MNVRAVYADFSFVVNDAHVAGKGRRTFTVRKSLKGRCHRGEYRPPDRKS
jgi:hypothetical protein